MFGLNRLIVPINLNRTYWIVAAIYFEEHWIQIYDSMGGSQSKYLHYLYL